MIFKDRFQLLFPFFALSFADSALAKSPLSYKVYGEQNQDTVILIHGFNSSKATWDKVYPTLANRYKVVVYDQPGHGDSPAEGKDFSPQKMADELKSLMVKKDDWQDFFFMVLVSGSQIDIFPQRPSLFILCFNRRYFPLTLRLEMF